MPPERPSRGYNDLRYQVVIPPESGGLTDKLSVSLTDDPSVTDVHPMYVTDYIRCYEHQMYYIVA